VSTWKRLLLRGIGAGAGFAITLSAIVGIWLWYSNRPKPEMPWNTSAIKATSTRLLYSIEQDKLVGDFRYSLENTTKRDYRLPANADLMVRLAQDMSYRNASNMSFERDLYIPAGQKVNISITLPVMYSDFNFSREKANDEKQLSVFVDRRLAEIDGFALFDPTNRYKVDFPNGWPESVARLKKLDESNPKTRGEPVK